MCRTRLYICSAIGIDGNHKPKKMNTKKITQCNYYKVIDSMGRPTNIYYIASNLKEAFQLFKQDKINYQAYYYGKLVRCYYGGVRGSMAS